ncbi:molecular chaperone (small heat shock protein) [Saccharomonospora marina XMU15]|uniref:Molecular chaperone (Small heat shock protein) n=1 Tax=Saccharomonospora marina XMU15 TaxID=882083 RepID=H5WYB3_9PSEU|nr:Hsp20/alpha crystallin family protein [Saccharomonospora marina]EHR48447.1 molecular chaperone (small heat shock protein) [Saccharomonospora marina XMU15]
MLMRTDPFQALDRLTQQWFGSGFGGGLSRSAVMPMDAYRSGDEFVVHFDLPGVSPESIDVDVQNNVLTVKAQRTTVLDKNGEKVETIISERPTGTFSRQLFLGDTLDTGNIQAGYDAGVLTLRIPVAEQAKPRKIAITSGTGERQAINA